MSYIPPTKEQFEAMSLAEQRVTIARDVIAGLRANKFTTAKGEYFNLTIGDGVDNLGLQSLINKPGARCTVCAIGACFVAMVDKVNQFAIHEVFEGDRKVIVEDYEIIPYLKRWFSPRQLRLMEFAFEGVDIVNTFTHTDEDHDLSGWADEFYCRYDNSEDRLIAIMENIIANNGEFKPEATGAQP